MFRVTCVAGFAKQGQESAAECVVPERRECDRSDSAEVTSPGHHTLGQGTHSATAGQDFHVSLSLTSRILNLDFRLLKY